MKKINILVACGTGVATSTIVAERVRNICSEDNINCDVDQCTIPEVPNKSQYYDIILTTSNYSNEDLNKPIINAAPMITGINEDKVIDKLRKQLSSFND